VRDVATNNDNAILLPNDGPFFLFPFEDDMIGVSVAGFLEDGGVDN
jgi:hypothetical protein